MDAIKSKEAKKQRQREAKRYISYYFRIRTLEAHCYSRKKKLAEAGGTEGAKGSHIKITYSHTPILIPNALILTAQNLLLMERKTNASVNEEAEGEVGAEGEDEDEEEEGEEVLVHHH